MAFSDWAVPNLDHLIALDLDSQHFNYADLVKSLPRCSRRQARRGLLAGNARVEFKEMVDCFAAFEKVDKALDRTTRTPETWRTAHAMWADPDRVIKPVLLFRGHNL